MPVLPSITARTSVRRYLPRPVGEQELAEVLEAARLAPSGVNLRAAKIYVLRDPELIKELNAAVLASMRAGHSDGVDPEGAKKLPDTWGFTYGAPAVLLVTMPRGSYNALADTGCLLENAMLQAASLGLGTCWLNNVRRADADPGVRAVLSRFGVGEDEQCTGALALGWPDGEPVPKRPEKGNQVIFVGENA